MPATFWATCAKVLGDDKDTHAGSIISNSDFLHLMNSIKHQPSAMQDDAGQQSGDELVSLVVQNIRLGGICKHFREVFSKLQAEPKQLA